MNTFSADLNDITTKFATERKAVKRLAVLLKQAYASEQKGKPVPEYTFEHLLSVLEPSSPEALSYILAQLVKNGEIRKIIRVESPKNKGGIGDFSSILEVPETIHDTRADQRVRVTPDLLRVIYRLQHA
jgi:hypothetical protein